MARARSLAYVGVPIWSKTTPRLSRSFPKTNHRLYEIIAKSRIEPCGTDNDCLLAVIHYLLFSFQFSGAVYRIRTRIAVFRIWSMRSTVKYIISRYLYHGSTIDIVPHLPVVSVLHNSICMLVPDYLPLYLQLYKQHN